MSWPAAVQTLKASIFFFLPRKTKQKKKNKSPKQENKQTKIPPNHILKMAGFL